MTCIIFKEHTYKLQDVEENLITSKLKKSIQLIDNLMGADWKQVDCMVRGRVLAV
jgi:hypothetical protein